MELSLLNLAIDSKLRSNDLLSLFNRVQYVHKLVGNSPSWKYFNRDLYRLGDIMENMLND